MRHLRDWLLPAVGGSEVDFAFVEWVVGGHHPAHYHASPPTACPDGAGPTITLLTGHRELNTAFLWLKNTFNLTDAPALQTETRNLVGANSIFTEIATWRRKSQETWDLVRKTPDARLVAAAAKNALIAADVAGSALPKAMPDDSERWNWIATSFLSKPEAGDLQAIVEHRLGGGQPRDFQHAIAGSQAPVTFVKAGCGTGKTVGAYMWAATNYPTRRLYFCYPTTGTATEGFKDYLFEPSGEDSVPVGAKLFHSRRDVDFDIILTTGPDTKAPEADAAARLESLEAWSTPVVACTVDTVLGLVQNNKRGLFAWPALAQSAFVFDEIHAYDDRLFGALLRFLRDLPGLPALLMTASLPKAREEALRDILKENRGMDLTAISGPVELETLPRYHKAIVKDNDPLPIIRETLKTRGKVLWVCNTVGRVMDAAERANEFGPLIYHSRFKYEHRVKRHKAVIDAFNNDGPALAVCSQVAEMSLDLSADLLVSDLAPVPALIQRLGRLNRRAKAGDPSKRFVVIEPDGHLPYTEPELDVARKWFAALTEANISQRQLAEKWEQTGDQAPVLVPSAWLDGGPSTTVSELREASPGITILMEEDRARVKAKPKDLARLVLPMPPPPRSLNWREWPKERGLPIAPIGTIIYDLMRGAQWGK